MSGEISKERLDTFEAPYKRTVWLDEVAYESGMHLLRVTIREGRRITQLDIDPDTAARWGKALLTWSATPKGGETA